MALQRELQPFATVRDVIHRPSICFNHGIFDYNRHQTAKPAPSGKIERKSNASPQRYTSFPVIVRALTQVNSYELETKQSNLPSQMNSGRSQMCRHHATCHFLQMSPLSSMVLRREPLVMSPRYPSYSLLVSY
jgi:hypothetical protein